MKMFRNVVSKWFIGRRVLAGRAVWTSLNRCHVPLMPLSLVTMACWGKVESFLSGQCDRPPASFCHQALVSSSDQAHLGTGPRLWPPRQGGECQQCGGQLRCAPKDSHPSPCEYFTLHGKRGFAHV